jgi:Iap family predicted aminopeptidase
MPTRNPAARASAARDNVGYSEQYRPGTLAKIRATIPEDVLDVIDNRPGISWLEFEYDHWLMDGTIEVLGVEDAIACWRQSMSNLIERPLLKNFVDGAIRLFSVRQGGILRMVPKGWTLAYRDFCVLTFENIDANCAVIHFEHIAPEAFESPGYLHCWNAICQGVFELERPKDGVVTFEIDESNALATATFEWK